MKRLSLLCGLAAFCLSAVVSSVAAVAAPMAVTDTVAIAPAPALAEQLFVLPVQEIMVTLAVLMAIAGSAVVFALIVRSDRAGSGGLVPVRRDLRDPWRIPDRC